MKSDDVSEPSLIRHHCGGELMLIEASCLLSPGYGYGYFECLKCKKIFDCYDYDYGIEPCKPIQPSGEEGK